jgi:hypothetical protein
MRLRRLVETAVVIVLAAGGAGCGTPTHLLFYQATVIGVDVATSPEQNTVSAKIGYDRQTGTIVPKTTVKQDPQSKDEPEAMSVIARARFKIRFLEASEICERFATGQAARNMAQEVGAAAALSTPTQGGPHACADW